MTWLALLARVRTTLRTLPPPIDVIAPPDPVDDLACLRRHTGLSEIMQASQDNVRQMDSPRGRLSGYAWTFTEKR